MQNPKSFFVTDFCSEDKRSPFAGFGPLGYDTNTRQENPSQEGNLNYVLSDLIDDD